MMWADIFFKMVCIIITMILSETTMTNDYDIATSFDTMLHNTQHIPPRGVTLDMCIVIKFKVSTCLFRFNQSIQRIHNLFRNSF